MPDDDKPTPPVRSAAASPRGPKISLLYALLGLLILMALLFLLMGGDSLFGITEEELHKRTPIFFSMMFICFGGAGWMPLQTVLKTVLPLPSSGEK